MYRSALVPRAMALLGLVGGSMLYGICTVVFPLFIMQPSFGLGIAASRTPNPTQVRLKSLVTHTVFGVGLYVCALGISYASIN